MRHVYKSVFKKMHLMMTSSNGNIFRVTGPSCGEFTGPGEFPTQRPVTRSFDVFFDLRLNKQLSKQPWGWWFETPSWSLWHQCNVKSNLQHVHHYFRGQCASNWTNNDKQGKSEGFESCDRPIVRKRPIWVKIGDVLSRVTLKFDG